MSETGQAIQALGNNEIKTLESIAEQVLAQAKQQGATSAEVSASVSAGLATSVRMGEVDTISFHRDKGIGITVYFGQCKGSASTSDTSAESIELSVKAACNIAKFTSEDNCAGLADKEKLATNFKDLSLNHPWGISAEAAIEMAIDCEKYARGLDERIINSEGVDVSSGQGVGVYANSNGFMHSASSTRHSMSCVLIGEKNQQMERDYWYTMARSADDLESRQHLAEKAVERTIRRLGAQKLSTRQAPVLFANNISSGLISSFISAISGSSLYRKASFLLDHLNKPVFASHIRIHENPFIEKGFASRNYDAEGVATKARDLVTGGVLQGYVLGSYSARKLGMETTGNAGGTHNILVESGEHDFEALLKEMGTGLYVTEVMGQGVNIVTGDYSRGASGFWVENGEIQYPVHEITIAGNLKDMYQQILQVGCDVDKRGSILTGSILIENMTIAGA